MLFTFNLSVIRIQISSKEDFFRSFFGRIEETINRFWDLLTFKSESFPFPISVFCIYFRTLNFWLFTLPLSFFFSERVGCAGTNSRDAHRSGHLLSPETGRNGGCPDFCILTQFCWPRSREKHVLGRYSAPVPAPGLHLCRTKLPGMQGKNRWAGF